MLSTPSIWSLCWWWFPSIHRRIGYLTMRHSLLLWYVVSYNIVNNSRSYFLCIVEFCDQWQNVVCYEHQPGFMTMVLQVLCYHMLQSFCSCGCPCYDTMVCCRSHGRQRNYQRTMSMHCIQWLCFVRWQTHLRHLLERRVFRWAGGYAASYSIFVFFNVGFMTQI